MRVDDVLVRFVPFVSGTCSYYALRSFKYFRSIHIYIFSIATFLSVSIPN